MTSLFPPFNRRASFRKQPYFFEQGRGVFVRSTGQAAPVLNLNFLSGVLDPRITFSRPSLATLYDSTGKLTYAPNNLLTYSNTFSNAAWQTYQTLTKVGGNITDPLGGSTAYEIAFGSNGASNPDELFQTGSGRAGLQYLMAIWVRAKTGTTTFRLQVDANISSDFTATTTWQQFYYKGTLTTPTPSLAIANNMAGNTANLYIYGATVSCVTYETTPRTQDQVITTSAAYYGPRFDYNPSTLAARGLLIEEARTNIAPQSNSFDGTTVWSANAGSLAANAAVSPEGNTNAGLFTPTAGSGNHLVYLNGTYYPSVTNGVTYAISFHVKVSQGTARYIQIGAGGTYFGANTYANFDLVSGVVGTVGATATSSAIQSLANGWYRITMIAPATGTGVDQLYITLVPSSSATRQQAATTAVTDTFAAYGTQVEAGSFATSYIPTGSSSVARSADAPSIASGSVPSFRTGGTVYAEVELMKPAYGLSIVSDSNSSTELGVFGSTQFASYDGTSETLIAVTVPVANTRYKVANAFSGASRKGSVNGSAVNTTAFDGAFTGTTLYLGSQNGSGGFMNGWLREVRIYTSDLGGRVQALTS